MPPQPARSAARAVTDDAAIAAAVRRDGLTLAQAAARFGISRKRAGLIRVTHQGPPVRTDAITASAAAAILGITPGWLIQGAAYRTLTVRRTPGGHRRYVRGEVEDLARTRAAAREARSLQRNKRMDTTSDPAAPGNDIPFGDRGGATPRTAPTAAP